MPFSTWAPLAPWADLVTLLVRLLMGGILVYYGWPKVKDPRGTGPGVYAVAWRSAP